jgi:integrase
MADIQQIHVESLLIHLENHSEATNGQKQRLAVSSQNDVIRNCGYLIDFLMQHAEKIVTVNPNQNYFSMVTYYNLPSMEKNTEYIPESIVSQLLMHINDICDAYQRILLIMLNCGLRFKEVAYLEEDCLNPISGESEYYKLRYIPWKVLESRRDRGLDDYHTIPIHKDIAEEIIAQTEDTKDTRLIWGLKEIFIKDYSYKAIIYEAGSFCDAANRCIKKNDIKVEGSTDPWRFKSRQCRKTFAVDMIENGATTEEVAAMLGHMQDATTEKYYAEVRKMRLADMNAEFYKKKFQVLITDEYLEKFTEVERKKLFIDFCMGYRERELGYCGKPFSEGPCSKRTGKVNCVNCTKLCVGEKHLPKCKDMAISQKSLVDSLIQTYKNEGIEEAEFEAYREYKAEKHWLNLYDEIVRKIEAEFSGVVDNKNIDNIIMEKG